MAEFKLKRGFDIKIAGKPEKKLTELPAPATVAIKPTDFRGIRPRLMVSEGDAVKIGSPLFHSKENEKIVFVAPVSGKVTAINRGDRRRLMEIVIENDLTNTPLQQSALGRDEILSKSRDELQEMLLAGGLWPYLRQRPYSKIANPQDTPRDIFISAMDTAPLAADPDFLLAGDEKAFQLGLGILKKFTMGKIHLSVNGASQNLAPAFKNAQGIEKHTFTGPHPAGNVGVHIHHIQPLVHGQVIWYISPEGVAQIGKFFSTGYLNNSRVIAVAGSAVNNRQYYKTVMGAPVKHLINESNLTADEVRIINGNVLTGEKTSLAGYTGFYNHLLSVIPEGSRERSLMSWFSPGLNTASVSRTFLSRWVGGRKKEYEISTLMNGGHRAFVATGDYEKVLPMDIMPVFLAKSILAEDVKEMEQLGILEVDEEEMALCSYICLSKTDFGAIVRKGLDLLEKEG